VGKAVLEKERNTLSLMSLIAQLCVFSDVDVKNYLEMTDEYLKVLLHLLKPHTEKQNTRMRRAISAEEMLTATLRFLATRRSFEDLEFTRAISIYFSRAESSVR
jgi:hypothetical protein